MGYWTLGLGGKVNSIQKSKDRTTPSLDIENVIPTLHVENMRNFFKNIEATK